MDLDRIKGFLLQHAEKFVFALVLGLSGYLVYVGTQKPNYLAKQQPDKLQDLARQVKSDIDLDHNPAIIDPRKEALDFDITSETERRDTPVPVDPYEPEKYWEDLDVSTVIRRSDPVLSAPVDVLVHSVTAIVAGKSKTQGAYALADLEPADKVEKVEKKTRPKRRSRSNMMDMEMMMMGGMGDQSGGGYEEEMMMDMEMMMGPSMGGNTAAAGAGRTLTDGDLSGFRPVAADDTFPVPTVQRFISGVALLPHKQNYESYEDALADASGYNPLRDTPIYHDLQIQRADVTEKSIDELTDQDWIQVWDRKKSLGLAYYYWTGFAPETLPADYRDNAVTLHIPPVMLDNYTWFANHPKIPTKSKDELKRAALKEAAESNKEILTGEDIDLENLNLELSGPDAVGGGGMMGGMEMMDMYGGEEMYSDMGAMYGGGMMIGMGRVERDPVEHKMIRFYDFELGGQAWSVKPGRLYTYRIRYGVVDPNFPQTARLQPKASTLDPETNRRVMQLVKAAEDSGKRNQDFWVRWGDWSNPTEPIGLTLPVEQFVGPVNPVRSIDVRQGNQTVRVDRDVPSAEVIASQLSPEYGTRLPLTHVVQPGMLLSGKAEHIDVVDPISLEIKKLPDAKVINPTHVIDITGGHPLAIDEELLEPGMFLLMKPDGSLDVSSSVTDQHQYRIYSFAEEKGK